MISICPLCGAASHFYSHSNQRAFCACSVCGLIHLIPEQRLSSAEERARYLLHQNSPNDSEYRAFLDRLLVPLAALLSPGVQGLDYGCGPGPTVSVMMRERGFAMNEYDPFFTADESVLKQQYDFITCTETAEHFFSPKEEFERLDSLLKPGGHLGVMTAVYEQKPAFREWYYAKDPTHVSIYTPQTIRWIADRYGWSFSMAADNAVIFCKPE